MHNTERDGQWTGRVDAATGFSKSGEHFHFCPGCGRTVVCPVAQRDCTRMRTGGRCTDCGGTWKRPAPMESIRKAALAGLERKGAKR